jgi:TolB-like protein/tetratricopeptide (TPR) repeat protein
MAIRSRRTGFGPFELDLKTGELTKSGRVVRLRPQPARVLCLLVSRAGELVSRDDIRRSVWGDSTFVDYDVGVDYCVSRIRSVLGDDAQAPRYVETVPRRGYRFICTVKAERRFVEPALAVLPFANLNGDPSREYFADGITDALITELARIPSLRVVSRQSVLHVKGSRLTVTEIARDLEVDGVVEGAVLQEGEKVRVTAQLILADPERHLWAETYDCDTSAVLATQHEAARAIAVSVATAFRSSRPLAVPQPARRPVAPEIVETYLSGRAELYKMTAESIAKALQCFREIAVKAPDFAEGLGYHAYCLVALGFWGHIPVREAYPGARQLALTALRIDERIEAAHLALAMCSWLLDWDFPAAEQEFRRTLDTGPSNPDGHVLYAIFLGGIRSHQALSEIQYALKLDPTSLFPNHAAAWLYLFAGDVEQTEAQARHTIELFPDALHGYLVLGWAAWLQDRHAEAVAAFERALGLSREAMSLASLGYVYGRLGRTREAEQLLRELETLPARGQAPPSAFAVINAGLSNTDAALDWLEKAFQMKDHLLLVLSAYPPFDSLRAHPRYQELARRIPLAVDPAGALRPD